MTSRPFVLDVLNLNTSKTKLVVFLSNILSCVLNVITISQPGRLGTKKSSWIPLMHSLTPQILLILPSKCIPDWCHTLHYHSILSFLTHLAHHRWILKIPTKSTKSDSHLPYETEVLVLNLKSLNTMAVSCLIIFSSHYSTAWIICCSQIISCYISTFKQMNMICLLPLPTGRWCYSLPGKHPPLHFASRLPWHTWWHLVILNSNSSCSYY